MGNREKAEFYLHELINLQENDEEAKYYFDLAIVYAALSDEEKMFYYLEKAVDVRVGAIFINIHPGWKSYRSDPRFKAIVKKAGLPE